MRTRLISLAAATIAVVPMLAGCGVPLQSSAEPLPANAVPAPLPRSTAPTEPLPSASVSAGSSLEASTTPATSRLRLWFVQEDGLASAESDLPSGSSADLILQSLAIGPSAVQIAEGLRTVARDPLTGMPLVSIAASVPTPAASAPVPASGPPSSPQATAPTATVAVQLAPAFTALPSAEQILLLGQVVLSLTGAGERAVAFVDDAGASVAVPLPDGRLLDVPATARDYNGLIVKP